MSIQPQLAPELPRAQKILVARGTFLDSAQPKLDLLVSLAADPDPEVGSLARSTLSGLTDAQCAAIFADATLAPAVARHFLAPEYVRLALLPSLLANPAVPQEAVAELAAKGGPGVVAVLLEHLPLLKTAALEALKNNPSCAGRPEPLSAGMQPAAELMATLGLDGKLAMAQGAADIPGPDRLAVLVLLAGDADPQVRESAQQSLRNIPEEQCLELLPQPSLPPEVARYFLDPARARPALLAVLLAHANTPPEAVTNLVSKAGREALTVILEQLDLLSTSALMALKQNPSYLDWQKSPGTGGYVIEVDLLEMLIQEVEPGEKAVAAAEQIPEEEEAEAKKEEGVFSKIAKMTVAKKVVLALRGNREERAILIRDGSKVVSRAVLSSPKLTDAEVESFAALKNVSQDVLRLIAMNRKFMKDYVVVRSLVNNPRLPIDLGLTLLNRLLPQDLRFLTSNRDISDTVRKAAHQHLQNRDH